MSIVAIPDWTASEWFAAAERAYVEQHQGCPWCGGSHRVFCQRRGEKVSFTCQDCDFQVAQEEDRFRYIPGETHEASPDTMCDDSLE